MPKPRTFTILARDLHQLIKPALAMAGDDMSLPVLVSVLLEGQGSTITATSTDRFRVGMLRHALDHGGDGHAPQQTVPKFSALLPAKELRQALTILKVGRVSDLRRVRITVRDATTTLETVDVSSPWPFDVSLKLAHVGGRFPDVKALIRAANTPQTETAAGVLGLNFNLLDGFRAASRTPRNDTWAVTVPANLSKPIGIAVGDHFVGALMPRRRVDGGLALVLDGWDDVLPEPAKPAAA